MEKSVLGKKWQVLEAAERSVRFFEQKYDLSPVAASVMAKKVAVMGLTDDVDSFINPDLKYALPNPFLFPDMRKAVEMILNAVKAGEKIGLIGDYDVDGATSCALIYRFLSDVYKFYGHDAKSKIFCKIPHRINDGYGPSRKMFDEFKGSGIDIVVTMDCGTSAFDVMDYADEIGVKVVIIDHHSAKEREPNCFALINPYGFHVPEEVFLKTKNFAAVGMTFLFCYAILMEDVYLKYDLWSLLDLVALGTVCDMMELVGGNRAFVKDGLEVLQSQKNCGIRQLCELSCISEKLNAQHIGFSLGPRINAGGRIGNDQYLGFRLLITDSDAEGRKIASELCALNNLRKEINASAEGEAVVNEEMHFKDEGLPFIVAAGNWHMGIIGIVAGRLKEKYNKPAFVISMSENGVCKGSARSVHGLHLAKLIQVAVENGVLMDGGGHAMAAGFALRKEKIAEFREFLVEYLESCEWDVPVMNLSAVMSTKSLTVELLSELSILEPYGMGNEMIYFLMPEMVIASIVILKDLHMKIKVADDCGVIDVMLFNAVDGCANGKLGNAVRSAFAEKKCLNCAVSASIWNDRVSVKLEDVG